MLKSTALVLAATTLLSPIALAETETFQTDIVYNVQLLETDEGAAKVLASITSQAKDACTVRRVLINTPTVDRDCVEMLVEDAKSQIYSLQVEAGRPAPDLFADASQASQMLTVQR